MHSESRIFGDNNTIMLLKKLKIFYQDFRSPQGSYFDCSEAGAAGGEDEVGRRLAVAPGDQVAPDGRLLIRAAGPRHHLPPDPRR